jgi:putative ABC transport system ATP-binding protein
MTRAKTSTAVDVAAGPPPVMAEAADVTRTFGHGATAVHALRGVSLTVPRGRLVALRGRSGSG